MVFDETVAVSSLLICMKTLPKPRADPLPFATFAPVRPELNRRVPLAAKRAGASARQRNVSIFLMDMAPSISARLSGRASGMPKEEQTGAWGEVVVGAET